VILNIENDLNRFRQIVKGRVRKDLKRYMSSGEIIGKQGDKFVSIPLPEINIPRLRYGKNQTGGVGQANQFMHFDESGLFIGQFGQPSTRPAPPDMAGLSGNAFSPTLVRDGPQLYLYHNDESTQGGVHRWRIDGWDDIGDVRERVSVGQTAGKAASMAIAQPPR
jgi:hypothetical protein